MDNLNLYKWLDAEEVRDASSAEKRQSKEAAKVDKLLGAKMLDVINEL